MTNKQLALKCATEIVAGTMSNNVTVLKTAKDIEEATFILANRFDKWLNNKSTSQSLEEEPISDDHQY